MECGPQSLSLDAVRKALERPARLLEAKDEGSASVAMILRETDRGLELLLQQRARHSRDPWSGNLAFPGGRRDPADADLRATAERETLEEVGLVLESARYLGRLDDILGAYLPVRVSCFVYFIRHSPELVLNHEVHRCLWVPLQTLCHPQRHVLTDVPWAGALRRAEGIDVLGEEGPLLWGITYRLVRQLLERLGALPGLDRF